MATRRQAKEKDYVAVAKKHITTPSRLAAHRRILVYGRNKKGKTTFALSSGRAQSLVIDCEHGTDAMLKSDPYVWHLDKWEDIDDIAGAVRTGELSPKRLGLGPEEEPFTWLVPDTLTRFNNLALRRVMRIAEETNLDRIPGLVDRRDYFKSGELMKEMLMQFHSLPINICYTAQERMKSVGGYDEDEDSDDPEYIMVPDLPDAVRGAANSWVEVIGRIYVVRVEVNDKLRPQRRLHVGVNDKYDTGYRSDFVLPDVIRNPTLPKLVQYMTKGVPTKKPKTQAVASS
jgi:hypothetical protein